MRAIFLAIFMGNVLFVGACPSPHAGREPTAETVGVQRGRIMAVGCATCILKMEGVTGCKLAVSSNGKPYLVSGIGIDDLGDAHAADGLCNAERKGMVEGRVEGDRFIATRIDLSPLER